MEEYNAIVDFEVLEERSKECNDKLLSAIKEGRRLYPLKVSVDAELDVVIFSLGIEDELDGKKVYPSLANIRMNAQDFMSMAGEIDYIPDMSSFDKMSLEEQKEFQESLDDGDYATPHADEVKELESD